jgi:hypothetical protein
MNPNDTYGRGVYLVAYELPPTRAIWQGLQIARKISHELSAS